MTEFTPGISALGGALIGLSAAIGFAALGKVTGVSGIAGQALQGRLGDGKWHLWFLVGLLAGPWLAMGLTDVDHGFEAPHLAFVAVAGVLVGWGTRLGHGCTSGHGICGISRLSIRSIVATCTFVGSGALAVFVIKHLLGWQA